MRFHVGGLEKVLEMVSLGGGNLVLTKEIPERKGINLRPETGFELGGRKEGCHFCFEGHYLFYSSPLVFLHPSFLPFPAQVGAESINHSFPPPAPSPVRRVDLRRLHLLKSVKYKIKFIVQTYH